MQLESLIDQERDASFVPSPKASENESRYLGKRSRFGIPEEAPRLGRLSRFEAQQEESRFLESRSRFEMPKEASRAQQSQAVESNFFLSSMQFQMENFMRNQQTLMQQAEQRISSRLFDQNQQLQSQLRADTLLRQTSEERQEKEIKLLQDKLKTLEAENSLLRSNLQNEVESLKALIEMNSRRVEPVRNELPLEKEQVASLVEFVSGMQANFSQLEGDAASLKQSLEQQLARQTELLERTNDSLAAHSDELHNLQEQFNTIQSSFDEPNEICSRLLSCEIILKEFQLKIEEVDILNKRISVVEKSVFDIASKPDTATIKSFPELLNSICSYQVPHYIQLNDFWSNHGYLYRLLSPLLNHIKQANLIFTTNSYMTSNVGKEFWEAVHGKENTLVIIKSGQYYAGGYAAVARQGANPKSFLFSTLHNAVYMAKSDGLFHVSKEYGPVFGIPGNSPVTNILEHSDLVISADFRSEFEAGTEVGRPRNRTKLQKNYNLGSKLPLTIRAPLSARKLRCGRIRSLPTL